MNSSGFTLIEQIVVISIVSILAAVGITNFKDFSSKQGPAKAVGQIQSVLRLAQSNATSSVVCGAKFGVDWMATFKADKISIDLSCGPNSDVQRTYVLDGAQIDKIEGSSCSGASTIPLTLTYSAGVGTLKFSSSQSQDACISTSETWTFTLKSNADASKLKTFKVSKGGAIDVQ